jgi:hypothetical protein
VNEWGHEGEYLDASNKALGHKTPVYLLPLADNQVLYSDVCLDNSNTVVREYYLKNYLTGEITYRFKEPLKLWGDTWNGTINDQYGEYLFLDKDGELILFGVREKREVAPGERLRRPEYVYYAEQRTDPARRPTTSDHLLQYNLSTREVTEINARNNINIVLISDAYRTSADITGNDFILAQISRSYRTLADIGNNQLLLYNNSSNWVLQLNESLTEVLSITEQEINTRNTGGYTADYIIPLDKGKYLGFSGTREGLGLMDELDKYYVTLLNEKGAMEKEYRDINMLTHLSIYSVGRYTLLWPLCLVSPDKQYALFFDGETLDKFMRVYVCRILYYERDEDGAIVFEATPENDNIIADVNDDRVRVRSGPGLDSNTLGYVNRGDMVKIYERGEKKQRIENMNAYWYRIKTAEDQEGWVYGAFLE